MRLLDPLLMLACISIPLLSEGRSAAGFDVSDVQRMGPPRFWRAVLGDVCQLSQFPHSTADPTRYLQCVRQNNTTPDRDDIGIWLLRQCPPLEIFVAPASRCMSLDTVYKWIRICDNPIGNDSFCLPGNGPDSHFVVKEVVSSVEKCACANGTMQCLCSSPEVFEPVPVNVSRTLYRSRRSTAAFRPVAIPLCSHCPASTTDCFCPVPRVARSLTSRRVRQVQGSGSMQQVQQQTIVQSPGCACPELACICVSAQPVACQPNSPQSNCQPSNTQVTQGTTTQQQYQQTTTTQQQYQPQPTETYPGIQPQGCPLVQGQTSENAIYQGICSWQLDPLAIDQQGPTTYLQCQPTSNNDQCGRWQRMPCSPGTTFDVALQLCVWHAGNGAGGNPSPSGPTTGSAGSAGSTSGGVVGGDGGSGQCQCTSGSQVGSCGPSALCPGQSSCQTSCSVCCY